MRHPWAIVCDFDGTAVTEDIGDKVSQRFAGYQAWRQAEDEYRAGAYGFSRLLERIFEPISATREEIAAYARTEAVLRPGFEQLVEACRAAGRPLFMIDEINITGFPSDGAEADAGWTYKPSVGGFRVTNGIETAFYYHYYVAEYRQYKGYTPPCGSARTSSAT